MNKKTTKTKKIKEINEAISKIDEKAVRIAEMNAALQSKNYNEAVEFIMRFCVTKDCQKLIQVLSRISDQPQVFKQKTGYDTLYSVAMLDGERSLFRKFMQLVAYANEGDRTMVEQQITRNIIS